MNRNYWPTLVMTLLLPGLAFSQDRPPKCNAQQVGRFWPSTEPPNDPDIEDLARSGDLQLCVRTPEWRYEWQHLTVSLKQLEAEHNKQKHRNRLALQVRSALRTHSASAGK
jgi:hypothetical protein